ncbi:MAG: hypothetical protein WEA36_04775 [Balneolaceae bacterium]
MLKSSSLLVASLILVLLVYGCSSNPFSTTQSLCQSESDVTFALGDSTYVLHDIPELRVSHPPETRPWDKSVDVLRDSIAANNGRATIGFKEPRSRRFMTSGIRKSICAEEFKQGLLNVQEMDTEILRIFTSIGSAHVIMDPDLVYDLVEHPRVDYIEIPMRYETFRVTGDMQTAEPNNDLHEQSERFIEYATSLEYYIGHQLIEIPEENFLTSKDEIEFQLDGQNYQYRKMPEHSGERIWNGRSTTTNGTATFRIYEDERVGSAKIWESEFTFHIYNLAPEDGLHILMQVDRKKFPPDG